MRPLGTTETAVWFIDQTCSLNFCMVGHLTHALDPDRLRQAIDLASQRHPLMAATVAVGPRLEFRPANTPAELTLTSGQWQSRAQFHLNQRFAPGQSLVRFELVHGKSEDVLLVCFHHCIGDGISGSNLVRDVLSAYVGHTLHTATQPPASLENLLPPAARGFNGLARLLRFLTRTAVQMLQLGGSPLTPRLSAPAQAPRTAHFLHVPFSRSQTQALQQLARQLDCTVHGILGAALARAVRTETAHMLGRPLLSFGSVVNVRNQLCPPPRHDVGLYISIATTLAPDPDTTSFAHTAQDITKQVRSQVVRGESLVLIPSLSKLFSVRRFFSFTPKGIARARQVTLALFGKVTVGLTNLGVLALQQPDDPQLLQRFHFVASPSSMGLLAASAATTRDRLSVNLCYVHPQINHDQAQQIVKRLQAELGVPYSPD